MMDTICAFVGCCKCGVERIGCEVFCGEHIVPMLTLRLQVLEAKIAGNLVLELATRKLEVGYRKYLDEGHLRFMQTLEAWMGGMAEPYPRKGSYLLDTSFKIHNVKERIKACTTKYPPELIYEPYYPWYEYKTVSQKAKAEVEQEQLPEPERIKAWIGPLVVEQKLQVREETPVVREENLPVRDEITKVLQKTRIAPERQAVRNQEKPPKIATNTNEPTKKRSYAECVKKRTYADCIKASKTSKESKAGWAFMSPDTCASPSDSRFWVRKKPVTLGSWLGPAMANRAVKV